MFRSSLLVGLLLLSSAAAAQKSPFTYQDLIQVDRISGLQVDPAGTRALYSVRATDLEKNKGVTSLWLKDLRQPERPAVRLAMGDSGAMGAQWGPDGQHLYFLRAKRGTLQVWRADAVGSVMEQLTFLPLDVQAFRVSPDGQGLVVAVAVFPDAKGDEILGTAAKLAEKKMGSGTVYDRVFVRHWDTWADGTRNHLFHIALPRAGDDAKAVPVALTPGFDGDVPGKPFGDEGDFSLSPDSKWVYFSAREAGTTEPWSTNFDIYRVPLAGGALENMTYRNKAWDASPRPSPDGTRLAYKAMKRPGFEADRFELRVLNADGSVTLVGEGWDRSVDDFQWTADGTGFYLTAGDRGSTRLFRCDIQSGKVTPLSGNGHIDAFARTPNTFVYLKSAMNSPSQLYLAAPKTARVDDRPVKLTEANASLATKAFGAYEQCRFTGWNNDTVHGYVVKPANYVEGRKYPVAFLIHGGPQGSFGDMWSYRWNAQTYAGAGYAVVMIDFHGSTGYGQAFTDAISTHWGDRPLEDLQKGWAYVLKTYPFLDGDRAAALGASYGGFMVNWIAGVWKAPWKCLVSHDGVFDARGMGYTTEEQWFSTWENGADVLTDPAAYDTFNPALHAKDWSVPTLIIHSDLDHRIPVEQGIGAFTALQARHVPSLFLRFPDENHWVLKPRNSMQWHDTVFGWLDRYIGKGAQ